MGIRKNLQECQEIMKQIAKEPNLVESRLNDQLINGAIHGIKNPEEIRRFWEDYVECWKIIGEKDPRRKATSKEKIASDCIVDVLKRYNKEVVDWWIKSISEATFINSTRWKVE